MKNKSVCPQTFLSKIPRHLRERVWIPVTEWVEIPLERNSHTTFLYMNLLFMLFYSTHMPKEWDTHCQKIGNWIDSYLFFFFPFIKLGLHTYTYMYAYLSSGKGHKEPMEAHFWQRDKLELGITFGVSNRPEVMKWSWWKVPWHPLLANVLPATGPVLFPQTVSLGLLFLPFVCLLTPLHSSFLLQHRKSSHLKFQMTWLQ